MPSSSSSCTSSTPASTARSTSIYDSISSCRISVYDPNASHFRIPVTIAGLNRSLRTPAMIDSGATALFINRQFVEKHKIFKHPLAHPIGVNNIDGTAKKAGCMTHFARLKLTVDDSAPRKDSNKPSTRGTRMGHAIGLLTSEEGLKVRRDQRDRSRVPTRT